MSYLLMVQEQLWLSLVETKETMNLPKLLIYQLQKSLKMETYLKQLMMAMDLILIQES
ncbi:Uncharacterised protein [Mycobacteroides abscessus subsp. massiliense]|nr:Uncharacterised protein [Mycobacteroides abscessus subsp. massiliense]